MSCFALWIATLLIRFQVIMYIFNKVPHTCSSTSSLFFLPSDWFLWGNRKSSAAVGTPGNTATRSCSSGKSDTWDTADKCTVTVIYSNNFINLWLCSVPMKSDNYILPVSLPPWSGLLCGCYICIANIRKHSAQQSRGLVVNMITSPAEELRLKYTAIIKRVLWTYVAMWRLWCVNVAAKLNAWFWLVKLTLISRDNVNINPQ